METVVGKKYPYTLIRMGKHPKIQKAAITLALRKPNKDDYTQVEVYRPITLLNSIGKVLELIIARELLQLAENNDLLPET